MPSRLLLHATSEERERVVVVRRVAREVIRERSLVCGLAEVREGAESVDIVDGCNW